MPFYDYNCSSCGSVRELLTPPTANWRKCPCGARSKRTFPSRFECLNTTSPGGEKFKFCEVGLGVKPETAGELDRILKETGTRPADEFRYTKGEVKRQEITEKELGQVLSDHNSLGTI